MMSRVTDDRPVAMAFGSPALSRWVSTALTLAILLLLSVNAATFVMNQRTMAYNDRVARSEEIRLTGKDLMILLVNAETGQRGFMLTAQSDYLDVYHASIQKLPELKARFAEIIKDDPAKLKHFADFQNRYDERLALMERTIGLSREGRIGEAVFLVRTGQGKALMDQMRADLLAIDQIEARSLYEQTQNSEGASRWTAFGNLAAAALILVLAGITLWLMRRYIREIENARMDVARANAGLENQVRDRTAELVRANEEIQRFAYIVSHDLRAPLVNVMGYTSELEQVGRMFDAQLSELEQDHPELVNAEAARAVREDVPEAVGFIRASTTKMDRLISAILKMSREGRRPLMPEPLDMTLMLNGMADAVRHQVVDSGGEILIGDLPDLISDRLIVEQVFGNLMDNAIKYSHPERELRVKIDGELIGEGMAEYRVTDNGRGVSERDTERVFELFRRAGKQDQPGEGLGLAFVRNSLRRLGGAIDLESELGKGSTFYIRLPAHLTRARVEGDAE